MNQRDLIHHYLTSFYIQGGRYLIAAGIGYLVFYVLRKKAFSSRKIQKALPTWKNISTELIYSFITILIFALVGLLLFIASKHGYTLIYNDISKYGYVYLVFSFFASVIIHDAYFYWMHRAIHHKSIFKYAHKVHHLSKNPTPWAAYSFHPIEGVAEAGIFPLLVFIMPFHPIVLVAFMVWQISFNVAGHLGYEIYPKKFMNSAWRYIFNSSTHHNMHHSKFKGNYGLYFSWWDRWMGTEFNDYKQTFNKVVEHNPEEAEPTFTQMEESVA